MQLDAQRAPSPIGALLVTALAVGVVGLGTAARPAGSADRDLAAAVTADGFALLEGATNDRHVVTVDRDGHGAKRFGVAVIASHARMVGTSSGVAMAWQNQDKVELAKVVGDGELGEVSRWGKRVVQLCDGVASNDRRWGVAWQEMDGTLWMVHGPTRRRMEAAEVTSVSTTGPAVWCALRSAGASIAFVWRDKQKRGFINYCSERGCDGEIVRLPVSQQHALEGIACNDTACLVALRDERGAARLGWMTSRGKVVWSKPLTDATPESRFSLAAAGSRAFVVGYVGREGATVTRAIESGSLVRAWADPYARGTPEVAWATDRLFVAHRHAGGEVAPEVVPLPE
ncbi:MAG: hypothetical protein JNL83_39645 [Myxococcales bacterium]|nr:hypothetical protein [Myxococcales bacterium]